MHSKRFVIGLSLAAALLSTTGQAHAQSGTPASPPPAVQSPAEPAPAPVLTEVDALRWTNAVKDMRIATMQLEMAQAAAREIFLSLQRPGYTFDPNTLTYKKAPVPPPAEPLPTPPRPGGGGQR